MGVLLSIGDSREIFSTMKKIHLPRMLSHQTDVMEFSSRLSMLFSNLMKFINFRLIKKIINILIEFHIFK